MKAISLHQPWASMIAHGQKTIETRSWSTGYRGELLICSTKKPIIPGLCCGYALCIVTLYNCHPMTKVHEEAACCELYNGAFAWMIRNIRQILPFQVRGRQGFFDVELPQEVRSQIVNSQ